MTKEELDKIHLCKNCKNKHMGSHWHYCHHSVKTSYKCSEDVKSFYSNYRNHYPNVDNGGTIDGTFPAVKKCKFYEVEL